MNNTDFQLAESQMDMVNAQYIVPHLSFSQMIIYIQRQSNTDCATHHLCSDGTLESSWSHGPGVVQVHLWVVMQHRLDLFCCFWVLFILVYLLSLKRRAANVCFLICVSVGDYFCLSRDILFVVWFTSETNRHLQVCLVKQFIKTNYWGSKKSNVYIYIYIYV